jgi:hypothetical protein
MDDLVTYAVDCRFSGKIVVTYELPKAIPADGRLPSATHDELEQEAKYSLSAEHRASPPFAGWTFGIRRL